jgi:SAM-dependent methyltransferase
VSAEDAARWDARHAAAAPSWVPHPILAELTARGRVLELAAGLSGTALALAAAGAQVTAVDVSEVAMRRLAAEASARGLAARVATVVADLEAYVADAAAFDLVLATRFWDAGAFVRAAAAVAPGGTLAWETFRLEERQKYRPGFAASFCLAEGEPAALLPAGFTVVRVVDLDDGASATRRLVARRG